LPDLIAERVAIGLRRLIADPTRWLARYRIKGQVERQRCGNDTLNGIRPR
jgi:hypothetical protein